MKATDLKIGNYVMFNGMLSEVTFLREDGKISVKVNERYRENITLLEPIPLTEEWLINFGFDTNPYFDRYEFGNFHIECDKTKGYLQLWIELDICHVDLKHVHQLQNLYHALTGKELKVKL